MTERKLTIIGWTLYTLTLIAFFTLLLSMGDRQAKACYGRTTSTTTTAASTTTTTACPPAPGQASNPTPADSATNVGVTTDLSWTPGSGAASHDVYFGTVSPGTFQGNQAGITFETGTMSYGTTYYWRIDEKNSCHTTTGTVWSFTTQVDNIPPTPDPLTWATVPTTTGQTTITMTATNATDATSPPVQYYFECTNDGSKSSSWQSSPTYVASNLTPGNLYSFKVRARDSAPALNTTGWSSTESATTEPLDSTPPIPDPMTWATEPTATDQTTITMTAADATDATSPPVQYYFECTNDGSKTSGWQSSETYLVTGLIPGNSYSFRVKAKDSATVPNETGWSDEKQATTKAEQVSGQLPLDGAQDVSVNEELRWVGGAGATSHDVYFGTAGAPPFVKNVTSNSYKPETMAYSTQYSWRIDERNAGGVTEGLVLSFMTETDTEKPQPDPLSWDVPPHLTDPHTISMTAQAAFDLSGVQYEFVCTSHPALDRIQTDRTYEVTGLTELQTYTFKVKAGDNWTPPNWQIGYSSEVSVMIPDSTPPTPDPMTWASAPAISGDGNSISMTASTASDTSGVEYYFDEITGNPGGDDSGWQADAAYADTGLTPGYEYTYIVRARDMSANYNVTEWSAASSVTITDNMPPIPNPMTWAILPHATGPGSISMTATTAFDPSGGVLYEFECTGGGGPSSGWISSPTYEPSELNEGVQYSYKVRAKDDLGNSTGWSEIQSVMTMNITPPAAPTNLVASVSGGAIQLDWDNNSELDLGSYCAYRSTSSGGPYQRIAQGIASNTYSDASVPCGINCYYVVTALDTALNESAYSNEAFNSIAGRVHNTTRDTWYYFIQDAIDDAQWGDRIEVSAGTYYENIQFTNKKITLTSTNPDNPALTIIDGATSDYVIKLLSGSNGSIVTGFTIKNGITPERTDGRGVYCTAAATLNSCIFTSIGYNESVKVISGSTLELIDCTFTDNHEVSNGMVYSEPGGTLILKQCLISDNGSLYGFIYSDLGTVMVSDCNFNENTGIRSAIFCSGNLVVERSYFSSNSTSYYLDMAGAITVSGTAATAKIVDSVFIGNSAANGGAIVCSSNIESGPIDVAIRNCTIINNIANGEKAIPGQGGGIYLDIIPSEDVKLIIENCILWGNSDEYGSDTEAAQIYLTTGTPAPVITHSCITEYSGAGSNGNIDDNPSLVDDYQLDANSPCINTGNPEYVPEEGETDLDGNRRIIGGVVDIGAYESGKVIYVDYDAAPPGDGESWTTAYKYLQDALAAAAAGDEIWVAEGTYWPDEGTGHTNDNRTETFQLKERIAVYGGFTGSVDETSLDKRNWSINKTILSGDLDKTNPNGTRCYHVVKGAEGALLDGLIITKGYANNSGGYGGGGMLNDGVSVLVENCIFCDNYAGISQYGGGMYNRDGSDVILLNCIFTGNRVDNDYSSSQNGYGGAIYNTDSTTICDLVNCTITANLAKSTGGIYNAGTNPIITNCIIWKNQHNSDMNGATLAAQIVGGAPVINYSCVTGWSSGIGNISDQAPKFVRPGYWDVTIEPESIVLEATIRDFIGNSGETPPTGYTKHPDFEVDPYDSETGIVGPLGADIGSDKKPVYALGENGEHPGVAKPTTHGPTDFNMWYNDSPGYNLTTAYPIPLENEGGGIYTFKDPQFFPIDGRLFGSHHDGDGGTHNFHFTLELHTTFTCPSDMRYFKIYKSDDDLFIYIDGKLVVDLGGVHSPESKYLKIEDGNAYLYDTNASGEPSGDPIGSVLLNLQPDTKYDFDLFYAERHTTQSHLEFSTTIPLDNSFTPGDYHLQAISPCIDAADNDAVPVGLENDIDAALRFFDGPVDDSGNPGTRGVPIVDMGAYEYQVQRAPVASNDQYSTYEGRTLTIDAPGLLANDTDENGDTLTVDIASIVMPAHGVLTPDSNGSFEYVPEDGFHGVDGFTYRISDGTDVSNVATVTIEVYKLLDVYAGADKTRVYPNNQVILSDSAVTGGDPYGVISVRWSIDTVPLTGTVDFDPLTPDIFESTSDQLHPAVSLGINPDIFKFEGSVDFILKLEANDGGSVDEDYIRITLKKPSDPNSQHGPVVNPGGPYTIEVGSWLTLSDAEVIDDGKPFNGFLGYRWSVESFPLEPVRGNWEFDDENNEYVLHPQIRFTQPGPYWLQLWATDGAKTDEGIAVVNVTGPVNHEPVVEAGGNYTTNSLPPVVLDLNNLSPQPSATDSDIGDTLTVAWSVFGPVGATFRPDRLGVLREVTFERPGTYILTLTANDGHHTISDYTTITIAPKPEVNAGQNKTKVVDSSYLQDLGGGQKQWFVTVPMDDASYKEHALPLNNVTFKWEQKSGPVTVSINPSIDVLHPTVTITSTAGPDPSLDEIKGVYKFTLEVTDGDLLDNPATDEVWITIEPDITVQPPTKKSVYIITSHRNPKLVRSYEISGNNLIYEGVIDDSEFASGPTAVGVSDLWEKLFLDYEYGEEITVISAKRLLDQSAKKKTFLHPEQSDPSAIVVDDLKGKIYIGCRYAYGEDNLWVYTWDEVSESLVFQERHKLLDAQTVFGLALDEEQNLLYVADEYSTAIFVYDTTKSAQHDWQAIQTIDNEVDGTYYYPVDVDIDIQNNLLYTTGYYKHTYLIKIDLSNSSNNAKATNAERAIGVSVDQATGLVYCTTYDYDQSGDDIKIYNSALELVGWHNPEDDEYAGAGIAVGSEIAYKFPLGTLLKSPLIEGGNTDVSPIDPAKDEITYTIAYEIEYESGDPTGPTIDAYITDYLPRSLDFVDASHNWEYDPDTRTVKWYVGNLTEGANNYADPYRVSVKVNKFAKPGGEVLNYCEIESNARIAAVESGVDVALWAQNDIIYVNRRGQDGSGISWEMPLRDFNEALELAQDYIDAEIWPEGGQIWVAKGFYIPGSDEDDSFVMVEDVNIYGGFAGTESSIDERDPTNPANETVLDGRGKVDYVVTGADISILNGFTITGGDDSTYDAGIYCNGTSPEISNCKIIGNLKNGIYCNSSAAPLIINNWIFSNYIGIRLNSAGAATIRNNTIVYNTNRGVYRSGGSAPEIKNCIVWDNGSSFYNVGTNVTYCCVEGGYSQGSDIIDDDPEFVDVLIGDFHISGGSPCIDSGDPVLVIDVDETDIDGEPRDVGVAADIGADEYPPIKVYAGKDKDGVISVETGTVSIEFNDAILESIDSSISVQNLTVLWTLQPGSATGINMNGQENALNPTFTFYEAGFYKLKLTAMEGADEKGSDAVCVWIDIGMSLSCVPEQVHLPDNEAVLTASDFTGGVPASIAWYGPEGLVGFVPTETSVTGDSASTTVTFNGGPGRYQLLAVALDAEGYYMGQQDIWVPVTHQQLDVSAVAQPNEITLPVNRVDLIGTVSGTFPDYTEWVVSDEAKDFVTFGDEHNLRTWAQFSEPGIYDIALLVYDDYDTIVGVAITEVTVHPYDYGRLVVNAGPDQEITLPQNTVILSGSVSGGNTGDTTEWIFSGPTCPDAGYLVCFGNPNNLLTAATFEQAGIYELALVVKNSSEQIVGFDIVTITINFEQVVVNAGPDVTVVESPTPPTTVNLSGTVTGGGWTSVEWISPHSSYCTITPNGNNPLLAVAAFTRPGIYEIALVAKDADDNVLAADTVTVTVSYQQVTIDAGEDQEITDFPWRDTVILHGTIIAGTPASTEWVFPDAIPANTPTETYRGPSGSLDSWVRFPGPGIYQIGLVAKNASSDVIGWDVTTVTVYPEGLGVTIQLTGNPVELTLPDDTTHLIGKITSGTYSSIEWVVPPVSGLIDITNEQETSPHEYSCDAVFHEPGIYEIGFVVRNHGNEVLGFEKIVIKVNPEPQSELGEFKIWADSGIVFLPCSPGQVTVGLHSQITGTGSYHTEWIDPTEAGLLDIDDPFSANTHLTFDYSDLPGTYYVSFVVRDTDAAGDVLGVLTLPITVYPCEYASVTVDAGADQEVTLPQTGSVTVGLDGTVTNVPETANVYDHVRWIDPTGDLGLVSFDPIDSEDTEATFTVPGTYELTLVAEDEEDNPLAGDIVTVTVHPYNQQDIYIKATAQPQVMTLLVDEKVDLIGEVRGLHDSVEWSISQQAASYVHFGNDITDQYVTSATFDLPGVYTFTFCAKLEGNIVGWASVDVQVKAPQVIVEAKARLKGSGMPYAREYSGISMSSDVTFDISGDVYGPLDLTYVTYEWTIVKDDTGTAVLTDDTQLTPEAEVTVGGSGACKLRFAAMYQGQIIGSNILWIVLISSQPIVDCGSDMDYPVIAPGDILALSKAKIWDNEPIKADGIEWANVAGAHFSSQNVTNPTVWFDSENTYTLTLTYTDDDGLSDSDTVEILCKYSNSRVFAGSDRTTIPFRAIGLNDAFAIPWEPDFTYDWTVESGSAAMVEFRPSNSVLNPEVVFKAHGDYVLKLTVHDGSRFFGDDVVNITVNKSPFAEENDPVVWFGDEPLPGTSPTLPACGTASVVVSATDEHLVDVWIEIDGRKYNEGDLRLDSGTWDDPQKLLFTITDLDTHSIPVGALHTLFAYASDKSGNIGQSAPVSFTTDCVIYDFTVNPDALTPANLTIDFTAELDPGRADDEWTLQVVGTTYTVTGTTDSVSELDVSMAALGLSTDGSDDGVYEARLISNGDTASVFFSVIFDAESNLRAALDDELKITYDQSGLPVYPRPTIRTITEGYFDLMGQAYHDNSELNGDVSSKIELYDSAGNARIITPGNVDAFGYRHGAVGSGSVEGLFGTLNLSTVADGIYIMKLTVKCGTDVNTDQARVVISNLLKVGNVKFSQEDLTVDVGGFPLTVTRTYDSFNKDKLGDFGFGWQYSFANMEIELNEERENMGGWTQRYGGEFDRDVTLNLPDGRRVTFGAYLSGYAPMGVGEYSVAYTRPPGVNAQLYNKDYQVLHIQDFAGTGYGAGWWWNDDYSIYDELYPVDLSLHDFSGWILVSDDGTIYNINRRPYGTQEVGDPDWFIAYEFEAYGKPYLSSIELTSGDKIKYSVDTNNGENPKITGVIYERCGETVTSNSIQIVRDEDTGCITGIWGPGKDTDVDAADVKYTYEAGNLVKVEKLVDAATDKYEAITYSYIDDSHVPSEHYITDVRDGRGLSPIRYVYDEVGRMVGVYDVRGNYIGLTHSEVPDAYGYRTETVTNRLGKPTTFKYDDKGRVVEETKYLGTTPDEVEIKTLYQYDGDNQNPSVVTDPLNNVTQYYYDSEDRVTITIDPENNVSTNIFDSAGNVTQVSQWRPLVSSPVFPSDYPYTLPNPAQYSEVSRTVNTYYHRRYDTQALNTTGHGWLTTIIYKTQVIDPATSQVLQETKYEYLSSGLLDKVIKVDPTGALDDVIVKYLYDETKSNSNDKPYSISNPYNEGEPGAPVYTNFSSYDDSGNVIKTWQQWENSADGDTLIDATVFTFIELDGQGRTIGTSRKVVSAPPATPWTYSDKTYAIILSRTVYDSIGKVDYTVNQNGVVTKNLYDDAGNPVETLIYETEDDYLDHFRNTAEGGVGQGYPADTQGLLTISQTLYDVEGRVILTVGPYAPGEQAQGVETVYDDLGRVVETRKWEAVTIPDIVWFKVVNGKAVVSQPGNLRVGRMVNPAVYARNAWGTYPSDETEELPVSIGWRSEDDLPVVLAGLGADQIGPSSYSKTVYDNGGRASHIIQLDESGNEQITSYAYDNAGKQTTVIDPLGHTVSRSSGIALYHGADNAEVINLATVSLTGTHKTITEYQGKRRWKVTDAENHTTEFEYDALGRIIKTIYPSSPVAYAHVGYDGLGRKVWESKQTTKSTPASLNASDMKEFEYDAAGRLTAVILPQVEEMESPAHDGIITEARPRYEYVYDDYGNLIEQWDNLYEQGGTIYDTYGRITKFAYQELNLQVSREMPDGRNEYKGYDPFGRIVYAEDFKGQFTGFEYNTRGQLEYKKHYQNPTAYESQNPAEIVQYVYDNLGRRTNVIETDNPLTYTKTTTYDYDEQGNLLTVTSPEGTINYDYYSVTGRKASTWTGSESSPYSDVDYGYDEMGRLEGVDMTRRNGSSVSEATSYEYTPVGNRWKMHLPNGVTTTYGYDNLNRLLTLTHYDSASTPRLLGSYTYTLAADGRRDSVAEELRQPGLPDSNPDTETHNITYGYDNLNRILLEQASDGGGKGYEIGYAYDVVGNRLERKVTVNTTQKVQTTYTYNALNDRLESENNTTFSMVLPGRDNKPIYAYVSGGRITSYGITGIASPVGHIQAFFLGLPSKWASWLFIVALVLIPVTFFGPVVKRFVRYRDIPHREHRRYRTLTLLRQGLIILLAYMMLIGPECFQSLAQAASVYDSISSTAWAQTGTTVTYGYDNNGSMTSKVISGEKSFAYDYNLQNKLERVTMTVTATGDQEITEYAYNNEGTRVKSRSWDVSGGTPVADSKSVTYFLVDSYNHTGYSQVLEEIIYSGLDYADPDPDPLTDTPTSRKTYTLGDDVITQQTSTADPQHLLYDGHGSTRQLAGLPDGSQRVGISEYYNYDAYGVMVDGNPSSASPTQTNMLYAGEQWDNAAQMYYLRARYYDPLNGRFNQMDPYAGNSSDPQSLHKYLYCHNNPVNMIDPSGNFSVTNVMVSMTIGMTVMSLLIPLMGATYLAVKGKLSILQIGRYLLNKGVWAAAIIALMGGALANIVVQHILFKFGLQIAKAGNIIIGFLSSAWGLVQSVKMTWDMVTGQLPPAMAELYIAIMVAGILLTVGLKLAMSSGKFKEFVNEGSVNDEGYWALDADERAAYDRGQSIMTDDIHNRLTQGTSVDAAVARGHEIASLPESWPSMRGAWEMVGNSINGGPGFTISQWLNTGATPQVRFLFNHTATFFAMTSASLNSQAAYWAE